MADQRCAAVLLLGAPGAGKGTQGRILAQIPGFFHLSSGDIFRSLDPDSPEAQESFAHTSQGRLAPDDLTIDIFRRWIDGQIAAGRFRPKDQMLVLDGIPRNVPQCELLKDDINLMQVLYLANSDDQTMFDRIRRRAMIEGRVDDAKIEIVKQRFEIYKSETKPVLDFYPKEMIAEIDPIGSATEVLYRILQHLIPVQNEFRAAQLAKRGREG